MKEIVTSKIVQIRIAIYILVLVMFRMDLQDAMLVVFLMRDHTINQINRIWHANSQTRKKIRMFGYIFENV